MRTHCRDDAASQITYRDSQLSSETLLKCIQTDLKIHHLSLRNSRTARQATQWELRGYKRKPGRPRKNLVDIIKRDLRQMDLTWEEAEELAIDKAEWRRRRVAQCSHLDAG